MLVFCMVLSHKYNTEGRGHTEDQCQKIKNGTGDTDSILSGRPTGCSALFENLATCHWNTLIIEQLCTWNKPKKTGLVPLQTIRILKNIIRHSASCEGVFWDIVAWTGLFSVHLRDPRLQLAVTGGGPLLVPFWCCFRSRFFEGFVANMASTWSQLGAQEASKIEKNL